MAYNINTSTKLSTILDNKPVSVKSRGNIVLDSRGNAVSQVIKPLEGEIIELQKRHYDQASTSEILDRGFSEIAKTKDKLTTDNFFNLYQELFYDLPKQGKRSHTFLIEESTKYIGGYEDPKDDKIDNLIERLTEIETAQIETPSEHPLFRNGTAIRAGGKLGIMQEGHLRFVSNRGDGDNPSPYAQLKKTLGLKGPDGRVLPDEDSYTRVTEQTWASLPKWPAGTEINEVADWSLSLNQFNVAASNITILKENIKSSELDQAEINFLIKELENKTPFLGNTLEDNFNGTIEYGPTDLLPFTNPGTSQGQTKIFYKGGEYGDAKSLYPVSVMNSIINKFEARDDKGIYGLGDNIYPKDFGTGHMSIGERRIEKRRRDQSSSNFTSGAQIGAVAGTLLLGPGGGTLIGTALGGLFSGGSPSFPPYPKKKTRYGNDWRSYVVEELQDLLEEINQGLFVKYKWTIDPERSFTQTTIDGIAVSTGQLYWVENQSKQYNSWAASKVEQAIQDHKAQYGNYTTLSNIEDARKGY